MTKRKSENVDKRSASRDFVAASARRRNAVTGALLVLIAIAVAAGLLLPQSVWQGNRERVDSQFDGSPVREREVHPEKPERPEFELPDDASPTQRLVAKLRDESFAVAERVVDHFPESPDAWYLLGTVHQRHRNEAGAIRLWDECVRLDPQFAPAFESFGKLALAKGDYQAAEDHLRKAVRYEPRSPTAPLALAETLTNQGAFDEAVAVLNHLVASHPRSAEGWSRLGQVHQQAGNDEEAKQAFLNAIEVAPDHQDAYHGLSVTLQKAGDVDGAQQYLNEFRRLETRRKTMFEDWTAEQGDRRRMEVTLANTYTTAGEIYAVHEQLSAAEEHWKRVAEVDAENLDSRKLLIDLYLRQNRLDEAITLSEEIVDLRPDDLMAALNLGVLCIRNRRLEEAERALRQAITLAPEHAETYALLAQVQMPADRDPPEAVALARTAVKLAPTAGHHYILATARWNAGDTAAARADLEQAIRLDPTNREYREAYAHLQQEQ